MVKWKIGNVTSPGSTSACWTAEIDHQGIPGGVEWEARISVNAKTRQEAEELQTQIVDLLNIGETLK